MRARRKRSIAGTALDVAAPGITLASRAVLATLVAMSLCACAGYRGGWESVPYVGAPPSDLREYRTPFEAHQRSEFVLPGITLGVRINNQIQTHDTQVYLYALPLSIDPRTVHTQRVDPRSTRVTLRIAQHDGDFVFRPQMARLFVADKAVTGTRGFEFAMWDQSGHRVSSGGEWGDRPVPNEYPLTGSAKVYWLSIEFPEPTPSPEASDISLDLSSALHAPGVPAIPLIRFQPTRWKEGYT
ncbi:MAG TPA: hypothetical protein VFU71_23505 [Burkholderiaceae bacterium]|nr:hypothetical protein [Burkholderiaceae bacterium]